MKRPGINYFEDEDYDAPGASQETIQSIISELLEVEKLLLALHVPYNDTRVRNIEISDDGNSLFVVIVTEKDDANDGVVVHRSSSEERIMHNLVGALRYFPPENNGLFVDFDIYTDKIKRRWVNLPDISEKAKKSTREEAAELVREEAVKFIDAQKESGAFMELTGMDFVSAHTADDILASIRRHKSVISGVVRTSS